MENISIGTIIIALIVILLLSGCFSLAEISMMALNRYRLKHLVETGRTGARTAQRLLEQTDRLLGVILLGNNLLNAAAATLTTVIAVHFFGDSQYALVAGTAMVTFLILIFSEITPKVIGATYSERIALPASLILSPLLRIAYPAVWFTNLFVQGLLRLVRLRPTDKAEEKLSLQELRTLVLESAHYIPQKHQSMLLNLFDLESITVDDVMTPRSQIEAVDIDAPIAETRRQLATCYHTRIPVYRGQLDEIVGLVHARTLLNFGSIDELDGEALREAMKEPYFIPAGTPLLSQLQQFQERQDRLGLVVDEYGELMGLITIDDILEEIIGEFTTHSPLVAGGVRQEDGGSVLVEGSMPLRELNRKLGLNLPVEGPKTVNGLILEHLQDIPEPDTSVMIGGHPIQIVQTQEKVVKVVRIYPQRKEFAASESGSNW